MVGQIELALRVAAAVVLIVTPALLFLGLWHGLALIRDDELIERARERALSSPSPSTAASTMVPDADGETVTCESCGTPNIADATYCQECLERLPARNSD